GEPRTLAGLLGSGGCWAGCTEHGHSRLCARGLDAHCDSAGQNRSSLRSVCRMLSARLDSHYQPASLGGDPFVFPNSPRFPPPTRERRRAMNAFTFGRTEAVIDIFGVLYVLWPMFCVGRILSRAGFSPKPQAPLAWFFLTLYLLWWFAFVTWPSDRRD